MHLPWRAMSPAIGGPDILTSLTTAETDTLREYASGGYALEIGAAYGYSTVVMALAGAHVTSVDPHLAMRSYGPFMSNLAEYRVIGRVQIMMGTSFAAMQTLDAAHRKFDLIFIDGDHTEETVFHDVTWALKLLRPGGTLICHDFEETCCCPGVRVAVNLALPDAPHKIVDSMYVITP